VEQQKRKRTKNGTFWLFVNTIPVLVEEKKIERQSKIETWLNLYQITREINTQKPENSTSTPINYII